MVPVFSFTLVWKSLPFLFQALSTTLIGFILYSLFILITSKSDGFLCFDWYWELPGSHLTLGVSIEIQYTYRSIFLKILHRGILTSERTYDFYPVGTGLFQWAKWSRIVIILLQMVGVHDDLFVFPLITNLPAWGITPSPSFLPIFSCLSPSDYNDVVIHFIISCLIFWHIKVSWYNKSRKRKKMQ